MNDLSIDITIPVINEEKRLENGIFKTIEFLKKSSIRRYRITIADNGSADSTEQIAKSLEKTYPCIRYIKVDKRGVGLALKKSWSDTNCDIIGYMDVDLATDINHLIDVYTAMQRDDVDIVNASRLLPESKVFNRAVVREFTSRGLNFILRLMLNIKFTDGMCGFKFIKKASYDKLAAFGLNNNDWFFCTELLIKAEWLGLNIYEIPVRWRDDGDSRVKFFDTTYKYMNEIIRLKLYKDYRA